MQHHADGAFESFGNGTSYPFDLHGWVQENYLASYEATVCTVPRNSMEEWQKKHRLLALEQGLKPDSHQHSSSCTISSCVADSNQLSAGAVCSPLDAQISSECFGNFLSPESFVLQTVQPRKFEHHERLQEAQSEAKPSFKSEGPLPKTAPTNCCEPIMENKENIAEVPSYNSSSLMSFKSSTGFYDSHCHIDLLLEKEKFKGSYANYMKQHKDSYPNSYNGCITVFHRPATFEKKHLCWKFLEEDNVWGAFGCHPKQAKSYNPTVERFLELALEHPKVRALGEIGLDYSEKHWQYKGKQQYVLKRQLEIAQRRNLRVVIHCREADDDAICILKQVLPKDAIFHLHCFTGTWTKALKWLKEFPNVFIGITNYVTFPNAAATHEVARRLPLDRLLLETDAPYFKPSKSLKRTRHAHPGMAIHVAAQIAALKEIPLDAVLRATCANTRHMYNLH